MPSSVAGRRSEIECRAQEEKEKQVLRRENAHLFFRALPTRPRGIYKRHSHKYMKALQHSITFFYRAADVRSQHWK